jgi:multidrug efflux system membrane fusion protein
VPTQIRAVGNVEAYSTVAIKSQVTGVIYKIHFKEGDDVKKDQLLFTIDPRPFEAAVKQAEANLSRDNAQLVNSREQVKRYAELVDKEYVSKEQYDQIRTNADAAQAVVEADRAAVDNAKVQLSYCYIYSPVSGRVGSFLINEGNLVRVNDGAPLVVINQVSPIFVSFAVPEQYLTALKRHMASGKLLIDASFPSDEGRPEQGRLEFIDNAVDRSTGTVRLKGVFSNGERRLWPGQFVNAALTLTTQGDAVVIPSESIQVGPEGQQVFVVTGDKRVEQRLVTVGQTQQGESARAWILKTRRRLTRPPKAKAAKDAPKAKLRAKNEVRHEYLGSLHTSPGRDDAGDARNRYLRRARIQITPGQRSTDGRFSDHHRQRQFVGCQRGDHGFFCGHAAREKLLDDRRSRFDELDEYTRAHANYPAVHFEQECRCRRARRASDDRAHGARSAADYD